MDDAVCFHRFNLASVDCLFRLAISVPNLFHQKLTEVKPNTKQKVSTKVGDLVLLWIFVVLLPDCLRKQPIPLNGYPGRNYLLYTYPWEENLGITHIQFKQH